MELYHGITSVCSVKVRVGLAEMELDYDSVVLDLGKGDQQAPDYLKLNPNGVVPTLVDRDLVLTESSLILEYLDREYNDGALMPSDRGGEVRARHWLLRCIAIHDAINTLTFSTERRDATLASKTPEQIEAMLAGMPNPVMRMKRKDLFDHGLASGYVDQALVTLDRTFADMAVALEGSDWINGPTFGISDIAVVSYIDRLERLGFEGLWTGPYPAVGDWLARMKARPSYVVEVAGKIDATSADAMRAKGAAYWPTLKARMVG